MDYEELAKHLMRVNRHLKNLLEHEDIYEDRTIVERTELVDEFDYVGQEDLIKRGYQERGRESASFWTDQENIIFTKRYYV